MDAMDCVRDAPNPKGGCRNLREDAVRCPPHGAGDWRTVWPVVSGMPNRAAGCRLVGNSVTPQIPYAIFRAIQEVENGKALCGDGAETL